MATFMETEKEIFSCTQCGDCCKGYGGTFVTDSDIQAMAAYLHIPMEEFISRYCGWSGTARMLIQGKGGYCVFWDEICTIHPVKPRMCRQWPYIKSVLVDITNWRIMAAACPGMRTDVADTIIHDTVKRKLGY